MKQNFSRRHELDVPTMKSRDYMEALIANRLYDVVKKHLGLDSFRQAVCKATHQYAPDVKKRFPDEVLQFAFLRNLLEDAKWHEVYDFIEFSFEKIRWFDNYASSEAEHAFVDDVNELLEFHRLYWRLDYSGVIVEGSELSLRLLETIALVEISYPKAAQHMKSANAALSRRPEASLEEAIQCTWKALESITVQVAAGSSKKKKRGLTLGEAVSETNVHPVMQKMYGMLWGHVSNIARHGNESVPNPSLEETELLVGVADIFCCFLAKVTEPVDDEPPF